MGYHPHPLRAARAVAFVGLICAGCAGNVTTFIHPQADFSLVRRVAVLPIENLTREPTASPKVRQLLIIELLSSGSVEVVDVGEVAHAIRMTGVAPPSAPANEDVLKLGEELEVQALIAGSVQEFSQSRSSGAPSTSVSISLRMIETDTGTVIWSSTVSKSGVGAMGRLFGVGGDSATERAHELIRKALKTLID